MHVWRRYEPGPSCCARMYHPVQDDAPAGGAGGTARGRDHRGVAAASHVRDRAPNSLQRGGASRPGRHGPTPADALQQFRGGPNFDMSSPDFSSPPAYFWTRKMDYLYSYLRLPGCPRASAARVSSIYYVRRVVKIADAGDSALQCGPLPRDRQRRLPCHLTRGPVPEERAAQLLVKVPAPPRRQRVPSGRPDELGREIAIWAELGRHINC